MYASHKPAGPRKELCTGYIDLGLTTEVRMLYGDRSASSKTPVGKYCFQIRDGDAHVVFSATSEREREDWILEIKEAIQGVDHNAPKDNFLVSSYEELDEMSGSRAHVMQEFPRKTGMLKKTAMNAYFGFRAIVNRFFRLDGGELSYYRDDSMKPESLGRTFALNGAKLVQNDNELCITVILATGKVLELEAATPKLAHEWKELIGESIHAAQREGVGTAKKRRLNISNFEGTESEAAAERKRKIEAGAKQIKSPKTIESIRLCLLQHFLMKSLSDLTPVLDALVEVVALPGDIIIWQGSHGDLFYILETGAAEIVKNGKKVGKIPAGKTFGELALLNSVARQATIKATHLCRLWTLDRDSFRKVLSDCEKLVNNEKLAFLRNVKLFAQLSDSTLEKIVNVIFVRTYLQGERIFTQGEKGDCFYMIQSGKVMVSQSSFTGGTKELVRLGPGKYFGEIALIEDAPRKATVTAVEKTLCWILDKPNFENILGNMKQAVGESIALEILKHVKILSSLTEKQLTAISRSLVTKVYKEGDAIITQGEDGDSFFMIAGGDVSVQVNHVEVAKLGPGKHFGEMSLLSNEKRSASIYAVTETTCLVLGRSEFVQLLGPLDSLMKEANERQNASSSEGGGEISLFSMAKNMTMRRLGGGSSSSSSSSSSAADSDSASASSASASKAALVVSAYSDPMFQLDYLYRLRTLGVGTFSTVHLVQHTNGKQYAMKVMFKESMVQMRQYTAVMREREIMKSMDHPFIGAMYATMQDTDTLYIIQEYMPGGDFWNFLYSSKSNFSINKKTGGLKSSHICFYASNVLSIISYLHDQDVAFRDIKPENLILDHSGYLKLVDFGCAQRVSSHNRLNTMVGTPEYIAPEVILSKGHTRAVDIWAFGVLLFEMATRGTPFEHDNAAIVYQSVIDSKEVLAKIFKTINGKGKMGIEHLLEDLILKLLEDNSNMRLGMLRNGIADIWAHPYFVSHGSSEDNVRHRGGGAQPPYVPHAEDEGAMLDAVLLDAIDAKAQDAPKYTKNKNFAEF